MNEDLEEMFKNRLEDEVYIDSNTVHKIINVRKDTFEEIKQYFNQNTIGFSHLTHEIIWECTAFDRRTEIKKENYSVELFIDFYQKDFKVEGRGG